MNTTITAGIETTGLEASSSQITRTSSAYTFCGKGLHYDWREIVAEFASADLDAELAQLGVVATLT